MICVITIPYRRENIWDYCTRHRILEAVLLYVRKWLDISPIIECFCISIKATARIHSFGTFSQISPQFRFHIMERIGAIIGFRYNYGASGQSKNCPYKMNPPE